MYLLLVLSAFASHILLLAAGLWRRQWYPTPVLLPGKSHGQRSLVGCGPWCRKELEMTERLPFHFSLSCIGEGNGNPLQCSCLDKPRGGGTWWAAIYGVTQSRTRLKWLSSSSSRFRDPVSLYLVTSLCMDLCILVTLKFRMAAPALVDPFTFLSQKEEREDIPFSNFTCILLAKT